MEPSIEVIDTDNGKKVVLLASHIPFLVSGREKYGWLMRLVEMLIMGLCYLSL